MMLAKEQSDRTCNRFVLAQASLCEVFFLALGLRLAYEDTSQQLRRLAFGRRLPRLGLAQKKYTARSVCAHPRPPRSGFGQPQTTVPC